MVPPKGDLSWFARGGNRACLSIWVSRFGKVIGTRCSRFVPIHSWSMQPLVYPLLKLELNGPTINVSPSWCNEKREETATDKAIIAFIDPQSRHDLSKRFP